MYAFLWKLDPMHTPSHFVVHIASHFNKNAYMHEQITIEFGVQSMHCGQEESKLVYPFFWCKPVIYLLLLIPFVFDAYHQQTNSYEVR